VRNDTKITDIVLQIYICIYNRSG